MKIDWKSKNTRVVLVIIAVIVLPILFNQTKSLVSGALMAYQMSQPKLVQVLKPEKREIFPEFETTGRIEAVSSINVIARVTGWLQQCWFVEGDLVKKGQRLYSIEPDEYQFNVKNAQATVSQNNAVFKNAEISLNRASQLLKEDLVSREYYDNALAERNRAKAVLDGSVAQLSRAKLDLSYTNIISPMNGRIGKNLIAVGNYVNANSGTLATIYSTSPMRVIFTLKSSDFIELKKYIMEQNNSINKYRIDVNVKLKLADGSIYDKIGKIEFLDNKIDQGTGAFALRAIFDNPDELLVPGDYVNVILQIKKPQTVMLVPQSATKTDVGTGYYVWTVKDGKAVRKNIVVRENIDNNWVVQSGLDYSDLVIVKGIQDIYQTGQKVISEEYVPENNNIHDESKVK